MPRSALEAPRWKPGQEAGLEPTGWKPALFAIRPTNAERGKRRGAVTSWIFGSSPA